MLKIEYSQETKGYFDYAASAPPMAEALTAFVEGCSRTFANPSSRHHRGLEAKETMEAGRRRFLDLAGVHGDGTLILTSGGSEANNLVLASFFSLSRENAHGVEGPLIGLAVDAHPSAWFAREMARDSVMTIEIDSRGHLLHGSLEKAIDQGCRMISISHVNSETGAVQDLDFIMATCAEKKVLLHVDGVQALGHMTFDMSNVKDVFYTFSSHKFGAPRGIGGVVTASPKFLRPQIFGGPQERGVRAGTENVPGLLASAAALEKSIELLPTLEPGLRAMAEMTAGRLKMEFPSGVMNSSPTGVPGLVSFSLRGLNPAIVLTTMALSGFCLSSGSACHEGAAEPSRTIRAMGRDRATALGTIRISMGYGTTFEDAGEMTEALVKAIRGCLEL